MTPNEYLAAILADQAAAHAVDRAQRSMDTRRISDAIESRKVTTEALMRLENRKRREAAHAMGVAAE